MVVTVNLLKGETESWYYSYLGVRPRMEPTALCCLESPPPFDTEEPCLEVDLKLPEERR